MTHLTKIYQHHFQRTLALSALTLAIPWQAGQAATLNVDTTADNGALTACTATSGDCSLRGAITTAVAGDSIAVPAGTYLLGGTEIPISVSLTINGAGATTTIIDAGGLSRIFNIGNVPVTINNVTIQHGYAAGNSGGGIFSNSAISLTLNNVNVLNNTSALDGGGINVYAGSVTLTNGLIDGNTANGTGGSGGLNSATLIATGTTFSNNRATAGNFGGAYTGTATLTNVTFNANQTNNGNGGGLGISNPSTINNSTFTNNHCTFSGGAIWAGTDVTVTSSTFTGNQTTGTGGAIFTNGSITLTSSTFTSNQAADDGGIRGGTTVTDTGSTFANNVATTANGGGIGVNGGVTLTNTQLIGNSAAGTGGGILIWFTGGAITSSLQNVLLANNSAGGNGAAVYTYYPTNILHTTIASQSLNSKEAIYVVNGAALTVKNTIVTNHATGIFLSAGTVTEDYNLFFGNTADRGGTAFTVGTNDVTGNPLFFNSAANDYHLTVGSAAIDKGVSGLGVTTDFEGETRPFGTAPDIGWDEAVTYNLTLATDGTGTGTVSSSGTPVGTSCGTNCLSYLSNTAVTLNANATNGSTFVIWTCTPAFTSNTPLTANTTCTATFNSPVPITHYHLATQTAGTGSGSVTGAGSYPAGTNLTLIVTPAPGSTFAGWSTGCSNNITLTADLTCTATFNQTSPSPPPIDFQPDRFSLFLQPDGMGKGTVTSDTGFSCSSSDCQRSLDGNLTCKPQTCSQVIQVGTIVTLTPQADVGSTFSSWGGHPDCATGSFLMDGGKLCIAFFHLLDEPLTITVQGQGHVTDTNLHCSDNCVVTYLYGTAVTLLASPATDWQFQAWSGDCNSTGQVLMTGPKTCGATFIPNPATVDDDLDHIPNVIEDAAPNHGDGNGDGIPDSQQNNVASFVDLVSEKYLTLQVDKGCPITNVYSDFPEHYPNVDRNHHFPQGLTYFELSCAKTQVTVYYHGISRLYNNLRFYKYGPTVPGDMKTIGWYKYPATFALVTIGGQPVMTTTYTLTDGQLGDSTGVDGKIVDPGGIELP